MLGIGLEGTAALVVEHWLTLRDLPLGEPARALLRDAAAGARIERPLPAAARTYLSALMRVRPVEPEREPTGIALPVRLLRRLRRDELLEAMREGDASEGALWEVAAVATGLSMSEWVWRELARAAQPS
jgi:hypothetical protein